MDQHVDPATPKRLDRRKRATGQIAMGHGIVVNATLKLAQHPCQTKPPAPRHGYTARKGQRGLLNGRQSVRQARNAVRVAPVTGLRRIQDCSHSSAIQQQISD